jgi:hypothetical protein
VFVIIWGDGSRFTESVALALLPKKLETLVEKRSPLGYTVVLDRFWRNSTKTRSSALAAHQKDEIHAHSQ